MENNQQNSPNPASDIDNDDLPVGKVLSRRRVLSLLGATGAAFLAGGASTSSGASPEARWNPYDFGFNTAAARPTRIPPATATPRTSATPRPTATATLRPSSTPSLTKTPTPSATATTGSSTCVVSPALTEGPYFVDEKLNRADIRSNTSTTVLRPGTLLTLGLRVSRISSASCAPLQGAMVDMWHADAGGNYSDVNAYVGQNFLRGYLLSDSNGLAQFTTIYPGWYQGRAVHIHFKVRVTLNNKNYEFTSQLFFNDALSTTVYAASSAIYAHSGTRTLNGNDGIYNQGGSKLLVAPVASGSGYAGTLDIGMQIA